MASPSVIALSVGVDAALKREFGEIAPLVQWVELPYDLDKLLEPLANPPQIVLLGWPPEGIAVAEVAQMIRGVYPQALVYLIADVKQSANRKILIKNGFTDLFFLPMEKFNCVQALREAVARLGAGSGKIYRKVKVVDVQADKVLNFNTYLHLQANNKYVKFSQAGESLDQSRVERLRTHEVSALSVPLEEMKEVYAYTAASLRDIRNNPKLSETERSERLESSAREVVTGLFNGETTSTEQGKQAVADLQNIVKSYILDSNPQGADWYTRFLAISAQASNSYSHAAASSSFAALLGIAFGYEGVENLAIAGLLHDLGMARIPTEVLRLPMAEWLPVDREVYEAHPEASLSIIKERKLVVAEEVHKIILQHHERFDGKGFPKGHAGDRICMGAQLLAIADELCDRTLEDVGKSALKLKPAVEQMLAESAKDPGKSAHNPALLKKVAALFEGC